MVVPLSLQRPLNQIERRTSHTRCAAPRAGDKKRRGQIKSLVAKADSAEAFKALILTPTTESLLLKMNWKVRKGAQPQLPCALPWGAAPAVLPPWSHSLVTPHCVVSCAEAHGDAAPDQAPRG
jgi:hypothetical protein